MSLILLIDTSSDNQMAALSEKGVVLIKENGSTGYSFKLHQAIENIVQQSGKKLKELDAVAVISGPGSYTGLRVGMSAAKGLCYALQKKLITVSALEVMARTIIDQEPDPLNSHYCPMLDARRNEVFTAIYDASMREIRPPGAMVLEADSFREEAEKKRLVFFGSGASKWKNICGYGPLIREEILDIADSFSALSTQKLAAGSSDDLIRRDPDYLKEFFFYR
jgi:tRNA threonylcarbamoyladenosine biosynthesis protein TsaB